jgi:hypothetical protein
MAMPVTHANFIELKTVSVTKKAYAMVSVGFTNNTMKKR